jgi:hypothetical protein
MRELTHIIKGDNMNKSTVIAIGAALVVGFLLGYNTRDRESTLARTTAGTLAAEAGRSASETPSATETPQLPEGHPPFEGMPASGAPMAAPGSIDDDIPPGAIEGLAAMRAGDYATAQAALKKAAGSNPEPGFRILQAVAAEGAGDPSTAGSLVRGDSELAMLRKLARDAFLQNQDIAISGPAYQLYLRLNPDEPNQAMMKSTVDMWKQGQSR